MAETIARVLLSPAEQKALAWLLHATDNGAIISGSELPTVMRLSNIAKRLGRPRDAKIT